MEKKRYDLCLEILKLMKREGVLDRLVLVGSWCVPLYEDYFGGELQLPQIRTRDVEFLIPMASKFPCQTDLYDLLKNLGFVVDHRGRQGYIIYEHPDLILEFFVPSRGRGTDRPRPVPELGISAQPLRFMDLLAQNTIRARFGSVKVNVPHPANFGFQKLLIARRRPNASKAERDRSQAVAVLKALRASGNFEPARELYSSMPKSWQGAIRVELTGMDEADLVKRLEVPCSR